MERIGEKLRTLRIQHGLTMKELADHLQTSDAQISRFENGQRIPPSPFILKVARFFEVSIDTLMKDELALDD